MVKGVKLNIKVIFVFFSLVLLSMIEENLSHLIKYYDEEYYNNYYDIYYNQMILSENITINNNIFIYK